MKARTKTHKKHGTAKTDLAKRKKPTVAKHVSQEFRSRRVKPTAKERIMAKASRDYETEEAAVETAAAPAAAEEPSPIEELVSLLENSYRNGGPVNPRMIELAKGLAGK